MCHRPHIHSPDEAFLTRDLVAFDEFGGLLNETFDLVHRPRHRSDPNDCLQLVADGFGRDADRKVGNDALLLESPQTLGYAWGRETHLIAQLLERNARIRVQDANDALVNGI